MRTLYPEDDASIVERCLEGDLAAWACLVEKYSALISVSIGNRLKAYNIEIDTHEIKDIRQEVLERVWRERKLETIRNRRDISYWFSIVSGNTALDYARRRRRYDPRSEALSKKIGDSQLAELIPGCGPIPSDEAARNEMSAKVEEALNSLPAKERMVAKMNLMLGKKYHEISSITQMPPGTVSSYIKRAKEKLRRRLMELR